MKNISVALCTYNGARFLGVQLASLLEQTRLPDELVVCDDGSTDATLNILYAFKAKSPFPVRIHINPIRMGSAKNFEKSIGLCGGSLIALCDQDDEWLPEKLEVVEAYFSQFPDVEAVFSDGMVVDAKSRPLGYTLWQHVGFTSAERRMMAGKAGMEVLLKHVAVTGATLVIRASLRKRVLPVPQEWMHDAWIALIAAASDGLRGISTPLVYYRQHGANVIGAPRRSLGERWRETLCIDRKLYYGEELVRYRLVRMRLEALAGQVRSDALMLLKAKLRHMEARARLPVRRLQRIRPILSEMVALGYRRYSFGWQVAVKDFLLPGKEST